MEEVQIQSADDPKQAVRAAIGQAIEAAGGLTALGERLGVSKAVVWAWRDRGSIPPEHAPAIESITGGAVTRRDLRPDDWHRIWPELTQRDPLLVPPLESTEQAAA